MEKLNHKYDGYFQMIEKSSGKVFKQIRGCDTTEMHEYVRTKLWRWDETVEVIFTTDTEWVHPLKFFKAIHEDAWVLVFEDSFENKQPRKVPEWYGTAKEYNEIVDTYGTMFQVWTAFDTSGNWLGTSEY